MILIYEPESEVLIKPTGQMGIVTRVQVQAGGHVSTEVAWWWEGVRHTAWVEDVELEGGTLRRLELGFREPFVQGGVLRG